VNASTEQEIFLVTNCCFCSQLCNTAQHRGFYCGDICKGKNSIESVIANLENSFPVFQFFQNQQDINDEEISNNSLLIKKTANVMC
jgi:hypothetical protein